MKRNVVEKIEENEKMIFKCTKKVCLMFRRHRSSKCPETQIFRWDN